MVLKVDIKAQTDKGKKADWKKESPMCKMSLHQTSTVRLFFLFSLHPKIKQKSYY